LKEALSYIDALPAGSAALSVALLREDAEKDAAKKNVGLTVIGNGGVKK